ncbi:MAG TPA: glutaredoxin domain-containing protein, partial [Candidatus Paceibacterota bacterium]|nr:glutaredoxin domain-containing protein [Candidatus Paceibacterota bacterium]
MSKVKIYSTPTCTYCQLAKQFFGQNGVEYTEYDVAEDVVKRQEMVEKTGQMGVPVIVIE